MKRLSHAFFILFLLFNIVQVDGASSLIIPPAARSDNGEDMDFPRDPGPGNSEILELNKATSSPILREASPGTSPAHLPAGNKGAALAGYTRIDLSEFEGDPSFMKKYDFDKDGMICGHEFYNYLDRAIRHPEESHKIKSGRGYILMRGKRAVHRVRPRYAPKPLSPTPGQSIGTPSPRKTPRQPSGHRQGTDGASNIFRVQKKD